MEKLIISPSPHLHSNWNIPRIMWGVVIAMLPAFAVSVYFFGLDALRVVLLSVFFCVTFEYLIQKYFLKGEVTVKDGSAVVTGMLLAFNVPSHLSTGIIAIGSLVAIGMAKMTFGGLGKNPFNPALVARVFLLISFPVQMTTWPVPAPIFASGITDVVTGATPLGILKEGLKNGESVSFIMQQLPDFGSLLMGNTGGSLGEVSAIALLLGGIYMLLRKIITWHIPVSYLGTVVIISGILWLVNPDMYIHPLFHLVTGGLMLGAFFMATDMVTSPMTPAGQLIFGAGCGLITLIIRLYGAYPEGVSFAILIMNAFVPLINKAFKPKPFGKLQRLAT